VLPAFLQRLQHAGHLLPATLTGYLTLKALDPSLPGFMCPLRAVAGIPYSMPELLLTRPPCASLGGDLSEAVQLGRESLNSLFDELEAWERHLASID